MSLRSRLFVAIVVALCAVQVWAADLPQAKPEAVGLSAERLDRVGKVLRAKVDAGEIPGFVALVARHGKIAYYEAYGQQDPNSKAPMKRDAIFRIYSMTKPLTSVAAMMLVEEGRMKLSDPVSMYLPELANLKVATNAATAKDASGIETKPATRP